MNQGTDKSSHAEECDTFQRVTFLCELLNILAVLITRLSQILFLSRWSLLMKYDEGQGQAQHGKKRLVVSDRLQIFDLLLHVSV